VVKTLELSPQNRTAKYTVKCIFIAGLFLSVQPGLFAQDMSPSIHAEQQNYYNHFGEKKAGFYDSLSGFTGVMKPGFRSECTLQKIVFGFHPYWAGSDYLNYQWNLLSDLCYFAYEVDPSTGDPVSYHGWLTDPAIDSAKANGVKVHLCATIFSGHNTFFTSLSSRQNLINNLVSLAQQRNADGVNMDIEAVPAYLRDSITAFMRDLSVQLKAVMPEAKVSIDLPAVDWGPSFDISGLDPFIDYYFVMGYDYYWNGSSEAGPVSPLYSLTPGYDYSISKTISIFEVDGIDPDKFILGIPYYGRQWKTESNEIPSHKLANGTALTYANIRSNSNIYSSTVYHWEPNSFSSCYIFIQNDNWNQCFIGLDRDLRKKYDIVNYRHLAGIGIWALGYDNSYPDLWQAISDKFSECYIPLTYDTLYDSGGPAWNYYNGEEYIMTIDQGFNDLRWLSFINLNLEEGYDSLWLYAGRDTASPFLGGFSGNLDPGIFSSPSGAFTLRFKSDALQNTNGWKAVFHDGSIGVKGNNSEETPGLTIYPNPAYDYVNIVLPEDRYEKLRIYDFAGRVVYSKDLVRTNQGSQLYRLNLSVWSSGIYTVEIINKTGQMGCYKFVKLNQ
jgi:GH18 family chitinase